jgi:putative iron-regulated protein
MAYAQDKAGEAAGKVEAAMKNATDKLGAIKERADKGIESYDQMIAEGNAAGNRVVEEGVNALVAQARAIEGLVSTLGLKIEIEGSDSLDNPSAVQ